MAVLVAFTCMGHLSPNALKAFYFISLFVYLLVMYSIIKAQQGEIHMRPVEFTPESIIQAGQTMKAAGRNITGFALRQKVGGGNPSRLKQVWDEHQSSQAATVTEPVAELPVEVAEAVATVSKALTERIAALAVELNDKAVKAAERRVHEVVRSAGEQRAQAERELADAAETVDDLEIKLDEVQAIAKGLQTKLTDVQTASQAQAIELAQVRERLALTEQAAKAATDQHATELARMNATDQAERTRHQQEAEQQRSSIEAERDQAQKAAAEARERAAGLTGKIEAIEAQNTVMLARLTPVAIPPIKAT